MAGPREVQVRLRDLRERLPDEVRVALLQRAAAHAIGIIVRRTRQGVDAAGAGFAPYSRRYAAQKKGSGRKATPVDLTLTGGMLAGMTVLEVTPARALIGFTGSTTAVAFQRMRNRAGTKTFKMVTAKSVGGLTRRKMVTHTLKRQPKLAPAANALKAKAINEGLAHQPRRHFFALSPDERTEIIAEAARTLRIRK